MKTYTIVRNGTIHKPQASNGHYCGFEATSDYPYRVTLTVEGSLQPPDYFILANEEMDEVVQKTFEHAPATSCEHMADMMTDAMCAHMQTTYPQWTVTSCKAELTGTNGLALLSCQWDLTN